MGEQRSTGKRNSRRKRRRRRRVIQAGIKLGVLCVIAVVGIHFLLHAVGREIPGFAVLFGDKARSTGEYISENDASLYVPKDRDDSEVRAVIKKRAKTNAHYAKILKNYENYPPELLLGLSNNEEMLSFVEGYPDAEPAATGGINNSDLQEKIPAFIQWDKRWGYAPYGSSDVAISGCAPTCLSMVVVGLTGNKKASPDEVAAYADEAGYYQKGTGTAWSLMTEGCEHYGVHGTQLSLDRNVIMKHLKNGEPVICSMRPGNFTTKGHFIVLTGVVDGKITVHDPNSRMRSRVLWKYETLKPQIKNLWAFRT